MGAVCGIHVNLLEAAKWGHLANVQRFLDNGADVNMRDKRQRTPLHWVSINRQLHVVNLLVERGANLNAPEQRLWTPLHFAAQNGHEDVVQMLLEKGAIVDATDQRMWTPLHITSQQCQVGIVKMLVEKGANVNAIEEKGWTPLHIASQNGHVDLIKFLVENGANVNASGNGGSTPLHIASRNGHVKVVEGLLAAGADLFATTMNGCTPLVLAVISRHVAVVSALKLGAQNHPVTCFCAGDYSLAEKRATVFITMLKLDKSAFAWIGDCLLQQSKHDEAKAAFLHGLEKNPADKDCALGLAIVPFPAPEAEAFTPDTGRQLDHNECVICMDKPRTAVCIPCCHLAGCYNCLLVVQKKGGCPICRSTIAAVIRVYTC
ncbi:hypothetical protein H310_02568 [Aphanomyces invadans]|uniref:RING-type domain-containing protein n=1 Tax=Aphanomyces invadans TaxID=157072 RepID=A0A024UKX3_9STRA|nr:hypothetical protein H310_02568 [Aphanomyces invadans]ETW06273.1 hypothetical protein H310_02568 [Aphanomyces invadans]|eukprot:XP_008864348.1 hypothetical protein H310_02568 [Aphanomyces invadans]